MRPAAGGVRRWLTGPDGTDLATAPRPVVTADRARRDTFCVRLAAGAGPVQCHRDTDGQVHWRLRSRPGGALLAVSAGGHRNPAAAAWAIDVFRYLASHAELDD